MRNTAQATMVRNTARASVPTISNYINRRPRIEDLTEADAFTEETSLATCDTEEDTPSMPVASEMKSQRDLTKRKSRGGATKRSKQEDGQPA
jgi:hypothetical protein